MKIIITVACEIDGKPVNPDPKPIEERDDVALHLIAECKAMPAPVETKKKSKKTEGGSNG
jgi:hypothetical protein